RPRHHPPLPSFPTRRSSDLATEVTATFPPSPATTVYCRGVESSLRSSFPSAALITIASLRLVNGPSPKITSGPKTYHFGSSEKSDRKSTRLNSSHVEISYAV